MDVPFRKTYFVLGIPAIVGAALDPSPNIIDQNCAMAIITFSVSFRDPSSFDPARRSYCGPPPRERLPDR
jgi:hypothetical protein